MQQIMSGRVSATSVFFLALCLGASALQTEGVAPVRAGMGLTDRLLSLLQTGEGVELGINVSEAGPMIRDALKDVEDEVGEGIDKDEIESLVAGLAAMKASKKATPGMTNFVTNVKKLIDEDMAAKVAKAHKASQKVADTVMMNFKRCKATKEKADLILKRDKRIITSSSRSHKRCRKIEQSRWSDKSDCQKLMKAKLAVKTSECNSLKILTKDPNSEANNCHTTKSPEKYGIWISRNYRWFIQKERAYYRQKRKCDLAKADHAKHQRRCLKVYARHRSQKRFCNTVQAKLEGTTCSYAKTLHQSCDQRYWNCYEESLEMYQVQKPILRKLEKDRKVEWRALMRIKCLLGVFAGDDGEVDTSTINTCKVKTHSTKHLTLNIPNAPSPEKCVAPPNIPCSSPYWAQEYRRLPRNAKAAKCSQCIVYTSGFGTRPIYWLKARNYHPDTKSWYNRGSAPKIRKMLKYGRSPWIENKKGHGASYPVTYLRGTWGTGIDFGNIFPRSYTICSLTRYTGTRKQGRILNGGRTNWLHGHWARRAGVAYYRGWKTRHHGNVRPNTNWVAMCGRNGGRTPGNMMVNGKPVGIRSGGARPQHLAVNFGWAGWERSDWAIAEIIIFQEQLPDAEMAKVMTHLQNQLKAPRKPGPDKSYKSKSTPCTAPQLSKLDPGQKDHRSFRCSDGQCIPLKGMCNGYKNCADGSDETICKKKKLQPNRKYIKPAETCTVKQRLKLRKGKGDDRTFRCRDGECIHVTGRCNGFRNCQDGSDEKYCGGKEEKKSKDTTIMVTKYTRRWPHCTNIRCFGRTKLEDAKKICLKDKRCDGFSFTASRLRGGRGGGCFKKKCKVDSIRGYGRGGYGYVEKLKKAKIARCENLEVKYSVWGGRGRGLDFSAYSKGLRWIGCMGNGCRRNNFYCYDTPDTLSFGANRGVLRALLGEGRPTRHRGCCSSRNPDSICNAMDEESDIKKLCKQLGYLDGKIVAKKNSNTCPEVSFTKTKRGNFWSSDFKRTAGYGYKFKCEGVEVDEDSDVPLGIQLGMKKVSSWKDTEEKCSSQIPDNAWGDCAKQGADRIGILIKYKSGYMGFASYDGVAKLWGKKFDKLKASVIKGFFQSSPDGGLHYLDYKSYPIAWSGVSNEWSKNFDLTKNPSGCSDGRASKKGWKEVEFTLYCKVKKPEK